MLIDENTTEIIAEILRSLALLVLVTLLFGGILAIVRHFEKETGTGDNNNDNKKRYKE